jgi:predicted DNA-binding transcriptional regulator YafY
MRNVIERILNLLAFLLTTSRAVTAEEIRSTVNGYDGQTDEVFRRMFERDKDLLRRLGIPIRLSQTNHWEVESGYVIQPNEYRLPDPDLDDEERAALWLAAQVVRIGGQPSGPDAILKLGGARTTGGLDPMGADLGADADLLASLYVAVTERRHVRFDYRDKPRRLAPHGIGHRNGHWYLLGLDDAGEERLFRTDRIQSLEVDEQANAFERTPGLTVSRAMANHPWETGGGETLAVTVRFDEEAAWWAVRRVGRSGVRGVHHDDGTVEITLTVNHLDAFVGWVLSFGAQAEVISPEAVRRAVIDRVLGVST